MFPRELPPEPLRVLGESCLNLQEFPYWHEFVSPVHCLQGALTALDGDCEGFLALDFALDLSWLKGQLSPFLQLPCVP